MTRHRRLARLLDVRSVELRIAARALAKAMRLAATCNEFVSRIGDLQAESNAVAGIATSYDIKSAATVRAALAAASAGQATRLAAAEAEAARLSTSLHHRRASTDVVVRALASPPVVPGTDR